MSPLTTMYCYSGSDLFNPVMVVSNPVAPTINVPELIQQSSQEAGWDNAVTGGGVLSAAQASKVLCGLSQEVDRYVYIYTEHA